MGNNERLIAEKYLELKERLESANARDAEVIKAQMYGIVFAYETYTSQPWSTFGYLLKRYKQWIK